MIHPYAYRRRRVAVLRVVNAEVSDVSGALAILAVRSLGLPLERSPRGGWTVAGDRTEDVAAWLERHHVAVEAQL